MSRYYRSDNYFNQKSRKRSRSKSSSYVLSSEIEYRNQNILRILNDTFEFTRIFSTKGVQGIVGFIKFLDNTMVFKMAIDINRSIEHEYQVLKTLGNLRSYLPHFIQAIGMIQMPITNKFINDPENTNPIDTDLTDTTRVPKNILYWNMLIRLPFTDWYADEG